MSTLPTILPSSLKLLRQFFTIEGRFVKFLKNIQKEETEMFYTYDSTNSNFEYGNTTPEEREKISFCIVRASSTDYYDQQIMEYYSFEDSELQTEKVLSDSRTVITYPQREMQFLEERYGHVEPELQINLDITTGLGNISIQNSISTDPISYDSVSSLGSITQESFTISATTGSATELITEEAETVTDVGGLSGAGRDREISNERVTVDTTGISDGQPGTVRTSGY